MSNERTDYRTAFVLFGLAVIIAMLFAFATTFERVNNRTASSEAAPGTTGLAKAHPPLDRAPGQPVLGN
jgi:Na+/melibiose symporter-like transporter